MRVVLPRPRNAYHGAGLGIDDAGGVSALQIILVILPNWKQYFNF